MVSAKFHIPSYSVSRDSRGLSIYLPLNHRSEINTDELDRVKLKCVYAYKMLLLHIYSPISSYFHIWMNHTVTIGTYERNTMATVAVIHKRLINSASSPCIPSASSDSVFYIG